MDGNLPHIEFVFPGPTRDRIVAAVQAGDKTATSSLLREYEIAGDPVPSVGDTGAVLDSAGEPVCVIRTVDVDIVALRDVPLAHALAEGEGYESVRDWRRGHLRFWTSKAMRRELGTEFPVDGDTLVVLERFVVIG
ncbi:ASCH domain-containing protein [Microbacterium enclense]|uniref:Uncharacterized protein YhfF n=1 Tax=Microbacterium enclense TaxID=993073 RepID=A0A1G6GX71_9MICO|nr:ASCH domain-containing protein [Microbacterium enclense]KSU56035.1 RNA-binding protein [Microbacterium enclense]SDB86660.1 Uncharacterized protein YhfF [Microbacterium enclense]